MSYKNEIFHILEECIDAHITAFENKKIVEGCYLNEAIDKATLKIMRLIERFKDS